MSAKLRPTQEPRPKQVWVTMAGIKSRFHIRSSTTVWIWVKAGYLPPPHHLFQRALWKIEDVEAAEKELIVPPGEPGREG